MENIRKRKHGEDEASFETSVDFSGREHDGDYKKKKKSKLECPVKSVKVELGDDKFHSEIRKGSVVAVDRHSTGETEACENSATESLADIFHNEKRKKKKRRDSDESEARKHHSVIGVSVDLGGKNKKEKDRHYRFTFPADFGTKNKSPHARKLSLNLNL